MSMAILSASQEDYLEAIFHIVERKHAARAKDIVEHCGVPRFLFNDFPLGNSAGKPHDVESQDRTLELALQLLESATGPRTTMQNPIRWNDDGRWKMDYYNLEQIGEVCGRRAGACRSTRRVDGVGGHAQDGIFII